MHAGYTHLALCVFIISIRHGLDHFKRYDKTNIRTQSAAFFLASDIFCQCLFSVKSKMEKSLCWGCEGFGKYVNLV